ncbi:hypothetical protein ACFL22_00170 [Patescibacteria group bacterium]
MNFLQNIQNKPEYVRWRILYITLAVCMAVVVSLWVWTVRGHVLPEEEIQVEDTISTPSPFKVLKDSGTVIFQDFIGGVNDIKSGF